MSFFELPHTADVKIRVRAPDFDTLFSEACRALMQVMYGKDIEDGVKREIELDALDPESLLLDFLSEILYITDAESLIVSHADVHITGLHLHASLDGELFDPKRHNRGTEVKGISYSGMSIQKNADGYVLDILFDV